MLQNSVLKKSWAKVKIDVDRVPQLHTLFKFLVLGAEHCCHPARGRSYPLHLGHSSGGKRLSGRSLPPQCRSGSWDPQPGFDTCSRPFGLQKPDGKFRMSMRPSWAFFDCFQQQECQYSWRSCAIGILLVPFAAQLRSAAVQKSPTSPSYGSSFRFKGRDARRQRPYQQDGEAGRRLPRFGKLSGKLR